ncbi:hypothetical protein MTO96_009086 [Rhipicephalus appendiculatus]
MAATTRSRHAQHCITRSMERKVRVVAQSVARQSQRDGAASSLRPGEAELLRKPAAIEYRREVDRQDGRPETRLWRSTPPDDFIARG